MSTTQIKDPNSDSQLKVNSDGSINVNSTGGGGGGDVNATIDGLGAFQPSQYTIGLTAIQITPTPLANRSSITLKVSKDNNGTIYIGTNNNVTTANGYPLYAGDTLGMDLTPSSQIWAIADNANQIIAALELA